MVNCGLRIMEEPQDRPGGLGAEELAVCLETATLWLERNAAQIDALNVFPVPDGDTGSNMLLSMRAGLEELRAAGPRDAAGAAAAFSRGALIGGQGNSGVILSQFWEGLARALRPRGALTAAGLVRGLREASRLAFRAVSRPVEGTILTTIREVAQEAAAASGADSGLVELLDRLVEAARSSVDRTPELLPLLRQAGVVDSGSRGLCVILEGFRHGLRVARGLSARGSLPASGPPPEAHPAIPALAPGEQRLGYCAEFLVQGRGLDPEAIRSALEMQGESLIVTGGDGRVRVHIHTRDPGSVLQRAASFGGLDRVQVRDMDRQHAGRSAHGEPHRQARRVSVVAYAPGEGLARVFESLGAGQIVLQEGSGADHLQALARAVESAGAPAVIVLPNGTAAAPQLERPQSSGTRRVHFLSAATVPQGIAAMVAFDPSDDLQGNVRRMEGALRAVRSLEVREEAPGSGSAAGRGEAARLIGLLEGRIVARGHDLARTLQAVLEAAGPDGAELATLFYGLRVPAAEAEAIGATVRRRYPHLEVEAHFGGQPGRSLIVSLE